MSILQSICNKLNPIQDVEIKYTKGKKFKITITSDTKLRIKVPEDINPNVERVWVERCKSIAKTLRKTPYPKTLRGDTIVPTGIFTLYQNGKHSVYKITGTTLEYAKKDPA